jgi:hypothetical protein
MGVENERREDGRVPFQIINHLCRPSQLASLASTMKLLHEKRAKRTRREKKKAKRMN